MAQTKKELIAAAVRELTDAAASLAAYRVRAAWTATQAQNDPEQEKAHALYATQCKVWEQALRDAKEKLEQLGILL